MRKYIAVVFPTEAKAYEGFHALRALHADGTISLYETVVIQRDSDGYICTKQTSERPLRRTGVGTLLGALVGMFGGPAGAMIGLAAGGSLGAVSDAAHWSISDEYIEDIGNQLDRGAFAVLAEMHERASGPVDARMAALGGKVLRETRADFLEDLIEKRVQAHHKEVEAHRLAQLTEKAERMRPYVESDMEDARLKLKRTAEDARSRLDETKLELDDKIQALDEQLAKTPADVRKEIEQRKSEIEADLAERGRRLAQALDIAEEALRA